MAERRFAINKSIQEFRLADLSQTPINLFSKGVLESKSGNFFVMYIIAQSGSTDVMSEYCGRIHPSTANLLNLTAIYEGTHAQAPRLATNGDLTANTYSATGLYVRVIIIMPEPVDV